MGVIKFYLFEPSRTSRIPSAVDYLQARPDVDPQRVGVMGLSLGASAAVLSGARDNRLAAVMADAPGATVFKDWPKPETAYESLYVPFNLARRLSPEVTQAPEHERTCAVGTSTGRR